MSERGKRSRWYTKLVVKITENMLCLTYTCLFKWFWAWNLQQSRIFGSTQNRRLGSQWGWGLRSGVFFFFLFVCFFFCVFFFFFFFLFLMSFLFWNTNSFDNILSYHDFGDIYIPKCQFHIFFSQKISAQVRNELIQCIFPIYHTRMYWVLQKTCDNILFCMFLWRIINRDITLVKYHLKTVEDRLKRPCFYMIIMSTWTTGISRHWFKSEGI